MVGLLGLLCLCFAGVSGQEKLPATAQVGEVRIMADQLNRTPDIITMKGNVRVTINGVTVYADEATLEIATGDLRPQGHVRISTREISSMKDPRMEPSDTPLRMPDGPWERH
jgi:lipopolysaccharide assembly outer membrane protein LptD (OstA)